MMKNPAATPAPDQDGLPNPRRRLATAAILSALVLVVLDGVIANLALPTLSKALDVSSSASVWVVTGYQLALVMFLLPGAAVGESLGFRRVYVGGVALFVAASALCALATSLPLLIAARFLQGIGGAAIMSLSMAMLRFTHPRNRLGAAIGWNALTVALSSAAGPTIGASILSVADWPWLFAVNVPIGLWVLTLARGLPNVPGSRRSIDLVSVFLNAVAFGGLVIGADAAATNGPLGAGFLTVSLAGWIGLIRRELPRETPLIPFDLLRIKAFRVSVVASICCFAAQMAAYVALPFYLQHGLGLDTMTTGLLITPWPLAVAVAAPLSGRLSDKVPTGALSAAGGVTLAVGLALIATWPLRDATITIVVLIVLGGLGFGFFQTPNNRSMLLSAPKERSGAAGGMQSSARLVGQTSGAVIVSVLLATTPIELAPRLGFGIAAALALAGGVISLLRVGAAKPGK